MTSVFISHSERDGEIARALESLIGRIAPMIRVMSTSGANAPRPGQPWFEWIHRHVTESTLVVVIVTSSSAQSGWVHWEVGAALGAAASSTSEKVIPVSFGLARATVPQPLADLQVVDGEKDLRSNALDQWGMEQWIYHVLAKIVETCVPREGVRQAYQRLAAPHHYEEYFQALRSLASASGGLRHLATAADLLRRSLAHDKLERASVVRQCSVLGAAYAIYLERTNEKVGDWHSDAVIVPSSDYAHYLSRLQQERIIYADALALVDRVELFWNRRRGQEILAGSERGRTRRIFVFQREDDYRAYASVVADHAQRYEVRVMSLAALKQNHSDYAYDFSVLRASAGDEHPVLARYVDVEDDRGIEFSASPAQVQLHADRYDQIFAEAISPQVPDAPGFGQFIRDVFGERRIEMSRYIDLDSYAAFELRHAYFLEMMDEMLAAFERHHGGKANVKVLEMGAGTGHFTLRLLDVIGRGAGRLTALEYDTNCYRWLQTTLARRGLLSMNVLFNEDSRTYDPPGKFDAIFSSFADHHIVTNEDDAKRYFENVKRNLHDGASFIVGDEFLPEHDSDGRADALRAYHHHILEVARTSRAEAPPEEVGQYDGLIALESAALQSGLDGKGDFKVSLNTYLARLRRFGLAHDAPIVIGPRDDGLRSQVGGIYVIRAFLPLQEQS